MTNKDLYELLGMLVKASQNDIQKAHRRLVHEHYPDANSEGEQAEERFKAIQQAYEVLSDPAKRREYSGLAAGSPPRRGSLRSSSP